MARMQQQITGVLSVSLSFHQTCNIQRQQWTSRKKRKINWYHKATINCQQGSSTKIDWWHKSNNQLPARKPTINWWQKCNSQLAIKKQQLTGRKKVIIPKKHQWQFLGIVRCDCKRWVKEKINQITHWLYCLMHYPMRVNVVKTAQRFAHMGMNHSAGFCIGLSCLLISFFGWPTVSCTVFCQIWFFFSSVFLGHLLFQLISANGIFMFLEV